MTEIYGIQRHVWAWAIGAVFAFLATFVGLWTVRQHLKWNTSLVAKYEIRILLMVPVYAVEAWLGLFQKEYTLYWDVLRESYEALVIYSFYTFLVTYLGGEQALDAILVEKDGLKTKAKELHIGHEKESEKPAYQSVKSPLMSEAGMEMASTPTASQQQELEAMKEALHAGEHFSPCNYCMRPYQLADGEFQRSMRVGILQYVPIKVFTAVATFILQFYGVYEGGHFAPNCGYPYIAFITNASQIWAMYCLVLFYHALYDKIKNIKPLAKFLAIKLVVFFTFWQSVAIAFFVELEFLHETQDYTNDQVAGGVQDFIICIEMFIAAVAHIWIFPYKEFHDPNAEVHQFKRIASVLSPHDLAVDMHRHMIRPVGKGIVDRGKKVQTVFHVCCNNDDESPPLQPDDYKAAPNKVPTSSTPDLDASQQQQDPMLNQPTPISREDSGSTDGSPGTSKSTSTLTQPLV